MIMPNYFCNAPGCNAASKKATMLDKYPFMEGLTFHPFPHASREKKLRSQWIKLVRREPEWTPNRLSRICSRHFVDGRPTQENPIPTLFERNNYGVPLNPRRMIFKSDETDILFDDNHDDPIQILDEIDIPCVGAEITIDKDKTTRATSMQAHVQVPLPEEHEYAYNGEKGKKNTVDCSVQTNLSGLQLQHIIDQYKNEKKSLLDVNKKNYFCKDVLKSNENIKSYTGLANRHMLNGLFEILKDKTQNMSYWKGQNRTSSTKNTYKPGPVRKLTLYEEFIMTMIRLRVGLALFVLSDLFGVSKSRVSQIFISWISAMHLILSPLLKWPSRATVAKNMPLSFKTAYPNTRAIIDCTEFFIEKPKNTRAQSATYSTYKSHNTVKLLVAIDPTGAFIFVSNVWGGNVSDRFITEHCGIIDLVEEGDDIMAEGV